MAIIRFLETKLNWDPLRKAKEVGEGVKKVLLTIGGWWLRDVFEGHFIPSAVGKYGYVPRTRVYMIRKAATWHHQRPLIWSGAFYAAARCGRLAAPRSGPNVELKLLFRGGFTNKKTGRSVREDLFSKTAFEEDFIQRKVLEGCTEFISKPEPVLKPVSKMGA